MTTNTPAPLTGDEIRAAVKHAWNMSGPSDATQPAEYVLAGALALLSKLRAPVSDEDDQPTAPDDDVIAECWITASDIDGIAYDGPSFERGYRAALASAPVAGEAKPSDIDILGLAGQYIQPSPVDVAPQIVNFSRALLSRYAAPHASAETLVRYCPGCGSIGPVEEKYRDCCPDGNQARMIPAPLAEKCRDTFRIAIKVLLADAAANDGAAPQASEAVRKPDYTLQHADHMAVSAERLMEAINARDALIMQREESDDVDDETMHDQHENVSEYLNGMRNAIYEYRKRRSRAALFAQPGVQKYWLCCGSKDPNHSNRRAPDCFNAEKAKWNTADQHSAAKMKGGSDAE